MADRGVYRGIYSSLPDDPEFQQLSSDARLVLYTCRLCRAAGPAAIFRYYPELLMIQTGLTSKALARAFEGLERGGWIMREGVVLWVKNGLRYDPSIRLADTKHRKSVERAVFSLPKLQIVLTFCDYYGITRPFQGPTEGSTGKNAIVLREGEGTRTREGEGTRTPPPGFERLWIVNPRKVGKEAAEGAYRKLAPDTALQATLVGALAAQQTWSDRQGRFFPHLATWLNGRRWEDEPPAAAMLTDKTAGNLDVAKRFVERMNGGRPDDP